MRYNVCNWNKLWRQLVHRYTEQFCWKYTTYIIILLVGKMQHNSLKTRVIITTNSLTDKLLRNLTCHLQFLNINVNHTLKAIFFLKLYLIIYLSTIYNVNILKQKNFIEDSLISTGL